MTPEREEEIAYSGLTGQAELLARGEVTSRELVELCLRRIGRLDGRLNAFRIVRAEAALAEADAADEARARGDAAQRPLLGVPFAVKDDTEIAGETTEHGSASRAPVDSADSEVVRRLRAAGLVVVGKTNLCELAIWPFTVSAAHGVTRNPWNPEVSCGGSSGGSAVAVAAGLVPAAHGTDGGGSIRIPAACCGLVGLKPTLGRVPPAPHRHGWQGLSTAGFITRTVGDNGVLLDLVGEELPGPSGSFAAAAEGDPPPLRVAVSAKPPVPAKVATQVRLALDDTAGVLATLGHEVVRADPPSGVVDVRFTPRYLRGIRDDFVRLVEPERAEPRTRAMAKMGARVPAALLRLAHKRSAESARQLAALPGGAGVLVMPTLATLPPPVDRWRTTSALRTFFEVGSYVPFTPPWNVTGQPAMAVPAGLSGEGIPLSVQMIGPRGGEATLLALAAQLGRSRPWAHRHPPMSHL